MRKSTAWHRNIFGTGPAQRDRSGRLIEPRPKRKPARRPTTARDVSGGDLVPGVQSVVSGVNDNARRADWPRAVRKLQAGLNKLTLPGGTADDADPADHIWSPLLRVDGDFGPETRRKLKQTVSALGSKRVIGVLA